MKKGMGGERDQGGHKSGQNAQQKAGRGNGPDKVPTLITVSP